VTLVEVLAAAWIALFLIDLLLPKGRGGVVSLYDAVMFASHLIVLAWGVTRIVDGAQTVGWMLVIVAAACFGSRMYFLFGERR
jgi:hypothetical protein